MKTPCKHILTPISMPKESYHFILCLSIMIAIMMPGTSHAKIKNGFFVGLGVANSSIGGDFDGKTFYHDSISASVCPSLDSGTGPKIILGYQVDPAIFEMNYVKTQHTGNWAGIPMDADFSALNMDAKLLVYKEVYKMRPLVDFGIGFTSLNVKKGSTNANGSKTSDATFSGIDYRFGVGVEVAIDDHIALDVMGIYRWGTVYKISGVSDGVLDSTNAPQDGGFTTSIELKYVF